MGTEVPAEAALREGASMHRIEEEVAKVQKGFGRTDAGREGRYCSSPLEYRRGRREGCGGGGQRAKQGVGATQARKHRDGGAARSTDLAM